MADSSGLRSIPLDHSGVWRLGRCLAAWARRWENFAVLAELERSLRQIGGGDDEAAAAFDVDQLRATDFCFRWVHFRDFRELVLFVKPGLPDPYDSDQETPIARRRAGDALPPLLAKIFSAEVSRLTGPEPDYLPDPLTHEEVLFYLTVCELCEPPNPRGAKRGRRYQDGLGLAVSEALGLIDDSSETVEGAARAVVDRWLADDRVKPPDAWSQLSFYDRHSCIAANGSDAARRRIREGLQELLAHR